MLKLARHGDILLKRVDKSFDSVNPKKELAIAYGEVTGHHHSLYSDGKSHAEVFNFDEKRYLQVLEGVMELRHQEHEMLKIEPGTYEIIDEQEYDPFIQNIRKVVD